MQPPPLERFASGKNDVAHGGDSLILVGANAQRGHGGWRDRAPGPRSCALETTGLDWNCAHCQVRSSLSTVEQLDCCCTLSLLPSVSHTHAHPYTHSTRVLTLTPASRLPAAAKAAAYASRNVALRPNDIPALGAPDIKLPPFTLVAHTEPGHC
jgi:hypothetical protein